MRKLILASGTWEYQIGHSYIKIRPPNGKGKQIRLEAFIGCTIEHLERVQYEIGPGDIRDYIEKNPESFV